MKLPPTHSVKPDIIFLFLLLGTGIIFMNSCSKENPAKAPVLSTSPINDITSVTAICGGNITDNGGATVTDRGVCWSTNQTPTENDNKTSDGAGIGNYTSDLTGLLANTSYNVRAYATNSEGTGYGSTLSFTTNINVTDIDGNVYNTVKIGTQIWMVENLKVKHYRNGDPIPNIIDEQWDNLTTGAYCIYDDNDDNFSSYGLLYNWYAVNDNREICPEGWHVPTYDEWETLAGAGQGLKETGTAHWESPNTCAPNTSGFTALPGGNCGYDGSFNALGEYGYWWTADEENAENAWLSIMFHSNPGLSGWINADKWVGSSIRCIKD